VLNPIHLRSLQECVRTGSFAEAARMLGYTASAVSQHMVLLERAVGAPLFERSTRSVRVTPVAEMLALRTVSVLSALATVEREAAAMVRPDAGTLRLASFATASIRILPDALAAVVAARPNALVHLDEDEPDEVLDKVIDGSLDAAVVFEYDLAPRAWPASLSTLELLAEPLTLIVPSGHPLAAADAVGFDDLRDEPWISTRADTAGAHALARLAAQFGFEPRVICRSNDYQVIRNLVARSLGVAMVPGLAMLPTARDAVTRLPVRDLDTHRRVLVLYREHNQNPLLRLALDCLARVAGTLNLAQ
jgi:DNA-binding transcriptional LysR family regulator